MDKIAEIIILALCVSADALACGFSAGTSKIKVPLISSAAAAVISAACMALGMAAGESVGKLLPETVQRYISFSVLAVFGLIKIAPFTADQTDINSDRVLSVPEGLALGAAISIDGLAAGFGYAAPSYAVAATACLTFVFTALALYAGAKAGGGVKSGRLGNIAAGLALVILAAEKLI